MKNKKILLVGGIIGSYRAQLLIDYLSRNNYEYNFLYVDERFFKTDKKGIVSLFNKLLSKILTNTVYLIALFKCDMIYILPMNEGYKWIYKISRLFNIKLISEFYTSRYILRKSNFKINDKPKGLKRGKKIDSIILNRSDAIIFLSNHEIRYYSSVLNFDFNEIKEKSFVHPLKQDALNKAKLKWFRGDKEIFDICWWGKASKLHGIQQILENLNELRKLRDDFKVHMFENDYKRAELIRKDIHGMGMESYVIVRHDLTFQNGLTEYLIENCDIAIGSFGNTDMSRNVLMNKLIDCLNLAIPVITEKSYSFTEFGVEKVFHLVAANDSKEFVNKINMIVEKKVDINVLQGMSKKIFEEYFNSNLSENFYKKIL